MIWLYLFLLVVGFVLFTPRVIVHAHWHQRFDDLQFSSKDFYNLLSLAIQERGIHGVGFARVTRREGGLFSARRECLRITYRGTIHDVCASPFGTGCYVSWWQIEERGLIQDLLRKSPTINAILDAKSDFQVDSEKIFRETIHAGIGEALNHLTNARGMRTTRY